MTTIIFPDEAFPLIDSYSPLDTMICKQKPFGDVTAEEYFQFAKEAQKRTDKGGSVDALSNAKRCFHYQIDRLLYRYGIYEAYVNTDFPEKVAILAELHILPSTLLRTFNRERNAMEHDYSSPDKEIVDGAIDLCDLLFLATERYLQSTPARIRIKFKNDQRDLLYFLEPGTTKINIFEIKGTQLETSEHGGFYSGNIYEFGNDEILKNGITLNSLPNEDIDLTKNNKTNWQTLLTIFSELGRNPRGNIQEPDEHMITMSHVIPFEIVKKFMNKIGNENES
ncbi:MAG: hypothetical protein AABX32_06570 [Nanoarchaeota archaeon]